MTGFLAPTAIWFLLTKVLNPYLIHTHISPILYQSHIYCRRQYFSKRRICTCSSCSNLPTFNRWYSDISVVINLLIAMFLLPLWPVTQKVSVFFEITCVISWIKNLPLRRTIYFDIARDSIFELSSELLIRLSCISLYQLGIVKISDFSFSPPTTCLRTRFLRISRI